MLWMVVCDGCNRYLCKSGAVGKRLDAVEDSETIATFDTRDFASAIAESQGWKSLSQGEIFCPECTAPKTSAADSRATITA